MGPTLLRRSSKRGGLIVWLTDTFSTAEAALSSSQTIDFHCYRLAEQIMPHDFSELASTLVLKGEEYSVRIRSRSALS